MNFSDFGKRFSGYSGITHLMDDLNEGLLQHDVVMMGGGNPAAIPAAIEIFERAIDKLQKSGELIRALTNYDGPQGNDAFIESLVHFFQHQYGWKIDRRNIALTNGSQSSFFTLFNSFASSCWHSTSVNTFPLGLVGRDTQINPVFEATSSRSKSTWYLNNPFSRRWILAC